MSDLHLAETIKAAIREWDAQRDAGASHEERCRNLEQTLRACWPFEREWHYLCEACRDTGWQLLVCEGTSCYRRLPHAAHEYVVACHCEKGRNHQARPREQDQELAAIGKMKPRKPTRYGRD